MSIREESAPTGHAEVVRSKLRQKMGATYRISERVYYDPVPRCILPSCCSSNSISMRYDSESGSATVAACWEQWSYVEPPTRSNIV